MKDFKSLQKFPVEMNSINFYFKKKKKSKIKGFVDMWDLCVRFRI